MRLCPARVWLPQWPSRKTGPGIAGPGHELAWRPHRTGLVLTRYHQAVKPAQCARSSPTGSSGGCRRGTSTEVPLAQDEEGAAPGPSEPRSWPLPTPVHLPQRKFCPRLETTVAPKDKFLGSHRIQGRFPWPPPSAPKNRGSAPKICGVHSYSAGCPLLALQGPAWTSLFSVFHLGDPDSPFHTKLLLQEACLGCGPGTNSLKVFSSSSQRRTSTTKRLWKALTEALSCGCDVESVFRGGGRGEGRAPPPGCSCLPPEGAMHTVNLQVPSWRQAKPHMPRRAWESQEGLAELGPGQRASAGSRVSTAEAEGFQGCAMWRGGGPPAGSFPHPPAHSHL